jgi:hypothetical protein
MWVVTVDSDIVIMLNIFHIVWGIFQLQIIGSYIPKKASGYLHESADVSVWLLNTMVGR